MRDALVFFLPLCLMVSLVYAATKHDGPWAVVREGLPLFVMTVAGLAGLGVVVYLICRFLQPSPWL